MLGTLFFSYINGLVYKPSLYVDGGLYAKFSYVGYSLGDNEWAGKDPR